MKKDNLQFLTTLSKFMYECHLGFNQDVCDFIACQFALESDFGNSDLAKFDCNLCGMKYPYRRYTLAVDSFDGFAVYRDLDSCKIDYLLWVFYNRPYQHVPKNLDSFKLFLRDSGYCPEKGYIQRIESIYNQYFKSSKN